MRSFLLGRLLWGKIFSGNVIHNASNVVISCCFIDSNDLLDEIIHYKNNKSFQNATPFRNYFSVNSEPDKKQFMRFVTTDQTSQGVTTELFMFLCNYICFLSSRWILREFYVILHYVILHKCCFTLWQHYVGNGQLKQINDLILRDWLR